MNKPIEPIVRAVAYSDKSVLVAANAANRDFHRPWATPFTDDDGFEAWWGAGLTGAKLSFVALQASGGIAGVVNVSEIVLGQFRSAYLGYYGLRDSCGRGLMTSAVQTVVRIAFADLGLHRLEANIQPENERSIKLVKRLGFRLEGFSPRYLRIDGEWRDHERWALVAD